MGNQHDGVLIDAGAARTIVGVAENALPNSGIYPMGGTDWIVGKGNIISGNGSGTQETPDDGGNGVEIKGMGSLTWFQNGDTGHQNVAGSYDFDTVLTYVGGNRIGTDLTGDIAKPNAADGIYIHDAARDVTIGVNPFGYDSSDDETIVNEGRWSAPQKLIRML